MAGPSSLRIACLQVAVAAFSFLLGTVILVAPDQLAGWPNSVFQARLPLWGVSFLLVSTGLFAIGAIGLPAPLAQATHLLAGALLLVLGGTVVPGSLPSGVVGWGVVGIGTALAPALARLRLPFPPTAGNLLPLLAGVANVGLGVVVLAGYSGMAGALPWCGAGLLASGGFLVAAELRPALGRPAVAASSLLAAAALLALLVAADLPAQNWPGALYEAAIAITLLLLPWTGERLGRVQAASLRARLAFKITAAAALPLIATVALTTDGYETVAVADGLARQQALATALAGGVADYIGLHRAAVIALTRQPDLLRLSPASQQATLRAFASAYPNGLAFSMYDDSGSLIAQSNDVSLLPPRDLPAYQSTRVGGTSSVDAITDSRTGQLMFTVAAPLPDAAGRFSGVAVAALKSVRVTDLLVSASAPAGARAYLVDGHGRVLAASDPGQTAPFAVVAAAPPVAALVRPGAATGAVRYATTGGAMLAGYAPAPGLGWGVVAERSEAAVLAGVHDARRTAYGMLLLALAAAGVLAVTTADHLARPLVALRAAAERLAVDGSDAPLPLSSITEVAALSAAFGTMRRALAERTAAHAQAEAALRAVNTELEQFAYTVSHDLKAPLISIDGFASRLDHEYGPVLGVEGRRYVDRIHANADRLTHLITDVLQYSRVGRVNVAIETVRLADLVAEVRAGLQARLEDTGGTIAINTPLPTVRADATALRQVFSNLLDNGLKYGTTGGPPMVQVGAEERPDQWRLWVRDQGPGIPPAQRETVFHLFSRLPQAKQRDPTGTGVGLATVKRAVQHLGGEIWIESDGAGGAGTTFWFTLPRVGPEPTPGLGGGETSQAGPAPATSAPTLAAVSS